MLLKVGLNIMPALENHCWLSLAWVGDQALHKRPKHEISILCFLINDVINPVLVRCLLTNLHL